MTDETLPWERNAGRFADTSRVPKPDDGARRLSVVPCSGGEVGAEEVETVEGEAEPETGAGRLSPDFLRGVVAEAERLIDERRDIALQLKAVRDAAKHRGVNIKAFNELLKRREMDSRMRDDFDQCLAIYETVAGLSRGVIEGGELRAVPVLSGAGGTKGKALAEALAWAGL